MSSVWATLDSADRLAYRSTLAFLTKRLAETPTIEWALGLTENDRVKRFALRDLFDGPEGQKVGEPWQSAWRLILESWAAPQVEHSKSEVYRIKQKLANGDRSGNVIANLLTLVAPRLRIEPFSEFRLSQTKRKRRIRSVDDLFSIRLTSGEVFDPQLLGLGTNEDTGFLLALANALERAANSGLDIVQRLGWEKQHQLWRAGQLHRVYYVTKNDDHLGRGHDPDEFDRGIAPSIKLLFFVVSLLSDVDLASSLTFVRRWRQLNSLPYMRLWAAAARDRRLATGSEVADFLLHLNDRNFWDQNESPEIAEVRAIRFSDLPPADQKLTLKRLRKRPPRNQWPSGTGKALLDNARTYWVVRELRRIELGGGELPSADKAWLSTQLESFPELQNMSRVDEGFMAGATVEWVSHKPDSRFDLLAGKERLQALQTALSATRVGWNDDPAERAAEWIRQPGNTHKLIADLESLPDGSSDFPIFWERFSWAHEPEQRIKGAEPRDMSEDVVRVLTQLSKLPNSTIKEAIRGISSWISRWEKTIATLPDGIAFWIRLWPLAVHATNSEPSDKDQADLQTIARSSEDSEPMDLDTLNTPAGHLVGVFLAMCPQIKRGEEPFATDASLRAMRDAIAIAPGRSGLIAKHRMIEHLEYFLLADRDWTLTHLIPPLMKNDTEALVLWRAVARRTRFQKVMEVIGNAAVGMANDVRLGRETRQSLVFSLVIECLNSFYEDRSPTIPYVLVQQLMRALDDEIRAHGADVVQQYVRDMSRRSDPPTPRPEDVFGRAAKPFLKIVWPQEQSLSTPGTSRAFADLPSTARGAFAEAVDAIERFLVPFECWSMLDYGLYGDADDEPKLSLIDDLAKADAFLRLLHLTIGDSESSVIPMDLGDALDQVRKVAPSLVETPIFRRLATAARRV